MFVFECNTVEELREEICKLIDRTGERSLHDAKFARTQKEAYAKRMVAVEVRMLADAIREGILHRSDSAEKP